MENTETVDQIYSDIMRYIHDAERISLQKARETARNADSRSYYALFMIEFALINRMLDLARCCVYSCGYADQNESLTNKVLIKRLWDVGVIDERTKQELLLCIDGRNQISHHFHTCTSRDLMRLYQKHDIICQCAEQWKALIDPPHKKHKLTTNAIVATIILLTLLLLTFFLFS
jgi:uncharacterized protein YutE (UPF0331/DUF86 family)